MRFLHSFVCTSFRLLPTFKIGLKFLNLEEETNSPQQPPPPPKQGYNANDCKALLNFVAKMQGTTT
jgi:hypothetical protein